MTEYEARWTPLRFAAKTALVNTLPFAWYFAAYFFENGGRPLLVWLNILVLTFPGHLFSTMLLHWVSTDHLHLGGDLTRIGALRSWLGDIPGHPHW